MVKVTQGNLPGQRAEGYHQYRGGFEKGEGFGVRRTIPTSNIQTKGDTIAQKRQKEDFGLASKIYSGWDILQKDFFTRGGIVDIRYDKQGKRIKRYLRGARWAIHDITTKLNSPTSTYPPPLGFCICGVDLQGEPAPGFTLNITTDKLRDFTYSEKNCKDGCFQPSSLSPLYEPYLLTLGEGNYGWKTAEEIHQITTLCVYHKTMLYHIKDVALGYGWHDDHILTLDFASMGIEDREEVELLFYTHVKSINCVCSWWIDYFTVDWTSPYCNIPGNVEVECSFRHIAHDGDHIRRGMLVCSTIPVGSGYMIENYVAALNI